MSCGCGDVSSCDDVSAGGLVVGVPGPRGPRGEKGDNGEGFGDLSVFGRSLVVAADAQAGRAALALPRIVYAADHGIAGDGVTDVSVALADLINSLPAGSVLQLDNGDYYCPSLRNVEVGAEITIKGVPGKTRLVGNGAISPTLNAARTSDVMLQVRSGAGLRIEDVAVHDHGILVGFDELIEAKDIGIIRCQVTDSGGLLLANGNGTSFAAALAGNKRYTFRHLRIEDCDVRSCELGVLAWTGGGWESATVRGCNFDDIGMIGVWIGQEGPPFGGQNADRDPDVFQPLQGGVFVHHNTFRGIRASAYTRPTASQFVVGVLAMGESVFVHDNLIDDVTNTVKWDDTEGIYTKARFYDVHSNVLINAGGSEAAINIKGGYWYAKTTLHSSMNGLNLPQSTLTVASTDGFPDNDDMFSEITIAFVKTSAGWQRITFTGKTGTTLTGVTGGTGTLSTGGVVRGYVQGEGGDYFTQRSGPGRVHDNQIAFTRDDVAQTGIKIAVPNSVVENNVIDGATSTAITMTSYAKDSLIRGNRILNHHGTSVIGVLARNVTVDRNTIINVDGSYAPSSTAYVGVFIANNSAQLPNRDQSNVTITNNYLYNPTNSGKVRVVQANGMTAGNKKASNLIVSGNIARNVFRGINITAAISALDLADVDNDFRNDRDPQPTNFFSAGTTFAVQRPIDLNVEVKGHKHVAADVVGALSWGPVPVSATAAGTPGQLAYANGFLYVCTATNTWQRAALLTPW
jgi:hypothetical protein